ncbi:MAG: glycosyltransferase family 92 protein [Chloroflexi bacterium]|nr:glycosyltransferase family 92 protein [Chloroflexota bacterium]
MDYLNLCLICKDENDYLPEWLDYHILMGVDRFYIYDNGSQVSLRETLKEYIEYGWVIVVDIPGKAMQLYFYDHCLQTFGAYTYWLGFIDLDEFLVPKTSLNLKELLKDYEAFGGLAVSSLFFGSNGHQIRPAKGQIASYTRRTHETFKENELVKCIIQPRMVLFPNSPHDFSFKDGAWCVNEGFLRVDGQYFPNYTNKIQLNHYFCRSEQEIELKMSRGRPSQSLSWPRKRFEMVNLMATYDEISILQNLDVLFQKASANSQRQLVFPDAVGLLEKMAALSRTLRPVPLGITGPLEARAFRTEFIDLMDIKSQAELVRGRGDIIQVCQMLLVLIKILPQNINFYVDLAVNYLNTNNTSMAWQALTTAWRLAPNTYTVLGAMSLFFIRTKNFVMVEKTCHLILEIAPHNLIALAQLVEALIGQDRYEEALKVGVPVVELSAKVGELPEGMGAYLVKKMADYLLEEKNYGGAARLWEAGVKCQPWDVNLYVEYCRALLLADDPIAARQVLSQAEMLASQNEAVLALRKQFDADHRSHKKK